MYIKTLKILVGLIIVLAVITLLFRFILVVAKPETSISLSQTAIVTKMQSLSKLETSSFTIEKIIEGGTKGNLFQDVIFGDTILLIAHGTVVGGFDLTRIQEKDVTVDGTRLHIVLPTPEILYSKLDNQQTKVYDRKLGLLTKGDKNLESEVRLAAEMSIREMACIGGVLDQASTNVRQQLSVLFLSLGFSEVTFEIPKNTMCQ